MIFLTALDDHPEPAPLGRRPTSRHVPTIAAACGFTSRDYVPDPMAAALGPVGYLCQDAPPVGWNSETPELLAHLAETVTPPAHWQGLDRLAAIAQFWANDTIACCDRVPGLTQPDDPGAPPLDRRHAEARLGNLRHGRPTLDSVYGGACLQGSRAEAARADLRVDRNSPLLRPSACADLRNAAHPDLLSINAILVAAHNDAPDPENAERRTRLAWQSFLQTDLKPRLCGSDRVAQIGARLVGLPLEAALGPVALLALALSGKAATAPLLLSVLRKCSRLSLPSAQAILAALDRNRELPRLDPRDLPPDVAGACPLPIYLLAEACVAGNGLFGPLGRLLLRAAFQGAPAPTERGTAPPTDRTLSPLLEWLG